MIKTSKPSQSSSFHKLYNIQLKKTFPKVEFCEICSKIVLWGDWIFCSLKVGLTFVRLAQILKPIDQIILAAKIFWKFWLGASICTLNEPCNINNILSTQNIAGFIITTRKVQIQIILVVGWERRKPGSQPRCSSCWGRCTFAPLRGVGGCRCRSQG